MVPFFKIILSLAGLLPVIACLALTTGPLRSGFHLPDSVEELTIKYKTIENLILLPVTINDTLEVNLILDTGTRNLVLFGKKFQKFFHFHPNQKVQFSGLGSGNPIFGKLSINNKVEINSVIGLDIPVVVVPEKNLFGSFVNVHGVVGYEIFQKFEIEINPVEKEITFRSPLHSRLAMGFIQVPLTIKDSRPILDCAIFLTAEQRRLCDLMIDTGSAFGLLIKTTDDRWNQNGGTTQIIGRGLNGTVEGSAIKTKGIMLKELSIAVETTRLIRSPWHNYASIGMEILKEYHIILNYVKGQALLKELAAQ
jgi:hypothetical protein